MNISPEVVILTRAELKAKEDAAFQRGVRRGRFEADDDRQLARALHRPAEDVPADSAWQPEAAQ